MWRSQKHARVPIGDAARTPLDDYMDVPEPVHGYTVFENKTYRENSTIHYLNVTTLEWMDGTSPRHTRCFTIMGGVEIER